MITLIKDSIFSRLIAVCAGIISIWLLIPYISEFINHIRNLSTEVTGLDRCIKITLKIIGVSFICEFASGLCIDAGESYLASKINFAGKIMIICIAAPDFIALINIVINLIKEI